MSTATNTKEHPILFSGEMVRAILSGRKTQTRRGIKPQPPSYIDALHSYKFRQRAPYKLEHYETGAPAGYGFDADDDGGQTRCPYGAPGDLLWVRETWRVTGGDWDVRTPKLIESLHQFDIAYAADEYDGEAAGCYRPSIHMPRWASRITLRVTDVRVERVQDISESDCWAEGIEKQFDVEHSQSGDTWAHSAFATLWDTINAKRGFSWESNPWVWAVTFERVE